MAKCTCPVSQTLPDQVLSADGASAVKYPICRTLLQKVQLCTHQGMCLAMGKEVGNDLNPPSNNPDFEPTNPQRWDRLVKGWA
mmetsp:Transcript_37296/g.66527  ORF Transcript_37296/g.66527 Transcript_37296/m.66527 type:complete len:83 (+) Transcript_37296:373-621(+)